MKRASRGSPAWTLCGAGRVAARFFWHKAMPGTPIGRGFPPILVGFGAATADRIALPGGAPVDVFPVALTQ